LLHQENRDRIINSRIAFVESGLDVMILPTQNDVCANELAQQCMQNTFNVQHVKCKHFTLT